MSALPALLDSLIDYAGLFPPARLPMADAVRNHAGYLAGPHRAALGRLIIPLARLGEFAAAYDQLDPAGHRNWHLSVLAGPEPPADLAALLAFNARQPHARIVSVETKAATPAEVARLVAPFPVEIEVWVEVLSAGDCAPLIAAIKTAGRGAKIRTGGVTPEAFPPAADVARFLVACRDAGVVCKATAGLHHPLRGDYRLNYEPGSPRGTMLGFLNVFLAATLLHTGGSVADATALLVDGNAENFTCSPDALVWRTHRFTAAQLAAARRQLCRSFGSCSFDEPLEGLQQLRWL